MGQGANAYASYIRIHEEMGRKIPPEWRMLSHVRRMAWEAAAQAVALSVLSSGRTPNSEQEEPDEDLDLREHEPSQECDGAGQQR